MKRRRIPVSNEYLELAGRARQEYFGSDTIQDCWIIAASVATGVPYEQIADEITKSKANWDPNRGAINAHVRLVLKKFGFGCFEIDESLIIRRYPPSKQGKTFVTPRQVSRFPSAWSGYPPLILYTNDHVACVKDGKVVDWSASSSVRITRIDAVIPLTDDVEGELIRLELKRPPAKLLRL